MSNYHFSLEAARARQEALLRQAEQDHCTQQHTVRRPMMRQLSRLVGYGLVHVGMRLWRYGRVERFAILRSHPARPESIQSN